MPHHRPDPALVATEAHLLYRRAVRFDPASLCAEINAALGQEETGLSVAMAPARDAALLSHPDYHVMIGLIRRPVQREAIRDALTAALLRTSGLDIDGIVARHRAHIAIVVGHGPLPADDPGEEATQTAAPLDLRLRVLKATIDALLTARDPLLIHWSQSRMIFTPEEYARGARFDLPLPLAIRPQPFTGNDIDGARPIGIRAEGSAYFAGATIVVDPAPRPVETSVALALSMLAAKHAGQLPLDHGDILDTPGGETLYIRREPGDDRDPEGRIALSLSAPAPLPVPQATAPSPAYPGNADRGLDPLNGQAAFADRVARLRQATPQPSDDAAPDDDQPTPSPVSLTERESDPRLRLPSAVAPKGPSLAQRLAVPVIILLLLLVAHRFIDGDLTTIITTDLQASDGSGFISGDTPLRVAPAPDR